MVKHRAHRRTLECAASRGFYDAGPYRYILVGKEYIKRYELKKAGSPFLEMELIAKYNQETDHWDRV